MKHTHRYPAHRRSTHCKSLSKGFYTLNFSEEPSQREKISEKSMKVFLLELESC